MDRIENKERGFKQSNLRRGNVLVELIELDSAVSPRNAIANFNDRTRIEGIFKIGFLISDFDKWVAHLRKQKADFHGNVVTDNQTGNRMVIIKDPDGNRIQLFEK